jgi:hypothetical protein
MSYFVVWEGAIHEAFDTLEEATASAEGHPGARVIGDEWVTLGTARDRVDQMRRALHEVTSLMDPREAEEMEGSIDSLGKMIDEAWDRLGLRR